MTYLCLLTVWWRVEGGGIKVVLYNIHPQLMTNHTIRMTRVVIEVNGNLHFSQIRHTEIFEGLYNAIHIQNLLCQIKIFE